MRPLRAHLEQLAHRHPEALEHSLQGFLDLLEAKDIAYLVNAARRNVRASTLAEIQQANGYGESWSELARLLGRLLASVFGR